ncbi:hypothetical protein N7478_012612 [Penicillium angulare]|uniref:uncharacterized protein n=1 Tax=Penicillium angulare TaxID=116970 RepID=UPI002541E4CA|nr:uncharacterized protein N7478_012612 [Penicillium angulare]KAJ5259631.1 hypothetical protein N7478_012612 [Penicillium angulare]
MIAKSLTTVAIIGGGPGGLATAIALSELPSFHVTLYEQSPEPREAGAGISLSTNAWKILDLLEASDGVKGGPQANTYQRNGHTGKVLRLQEQPENSAGDVRGSIRARRTRLQSALLARVLPDTIVYNKKLVSLESVPDGGVRLNFKDGTEVIPDLVVGADGIRSIVRRILFPNHELHFTGNTAWRVLIQKSSLTHIPDVTDATAWWWGQNGHVYFSDVDDETENPDPYFEITVRSYTEPEAPGLTVPWGISATNDKVASRVSKFDKRVRDAVAVVPEGHWREFAGYAGPRLERAFGSGATFAMEDGWILARALEEKRLSDSPIQGALDIFDRIRSPYYHKMYEHIDNNHDKMQQQTKLKTHNLDEFLQARVDNILGGNKDFIYKNDIRKVWEDYVTALAVEN